MAKRYLQPQCVAQIDRFNPNIPPLEMLYVPSVSVELVTNKAPTISGMSMGVTTAGISVRDTGAGGYIRFADVPLSGDIVVGAVFSVTRTDSFQELVCRILEAPPYPQNYNLYVYNGKLVFTSSADSYGFLDYAISANTVYRVVGVFHSSTKVWSLYVNGKLVATRTGTQNPDYTYAGQETRVGTNNGAGGSLQGDVMLAFIGSKAPPSQAAKSLSDNPWQIFRAPSQALFLAAGGGVTWTLDPTSSSHGQSSSVGALALSYIISAQSASHAHSATADEITTGKIFNPVAANHAQSTTNPMIAFNVTYAPENSSHSQAATSPTITMVYTLSPSGTLHAQASTASNVSSGNVLDPVSSSHAQAATSPAISLNITTSPVSTSHVLTAGSSTLNLSYVLSVNGVDHAQTTGQCTLTIGGGAGTGATVEEIATAVWAHVTRTLTVSAGPSAESIAAAVLASLNATTIPVDVQKTNGVEIVGTGTSSDKFRSILYVG